MAPVLFPVEKESDLLLIKIAREVAIDHYTIEQILQRYSIDSERWEWIKHDPRFHHYLESEITSWQAATNTHERTKLKAAALIEEFLPEANARLHDSNMALPGKVELFKAISRIAGMGLNNADVNTGAGERFSVTINLGSDTQLKYSKELPPKVIDAEPV